MMLVCYGLALLIASGVSATFVRHSHAGDERTAKATRLDPVTQETAICIGYVDVETGVASLYPAQPGRVAQILVHEDQDVTANTVLMRLDDRSARFLLRQAEDDLKSAELQLSEAKKLPRQHQLKITQQKQAIEAASHRLSAGRLGLERKLNLVKAQQIAVEDAEVAAELVKELEAGLAAEEQKLQSLQLLDPDTQIAKAEVDVSAKQTRRDMARYALDECSLRAPCDGKILRTFVKVGEVLGATPREPAIQFCPGGDRIVRAEIEQEFAAKVHVGASATITDDASTGPTWHGKVIRVSDWFTHRRSILQEPLQFNDVRTVECIVLLERSQDPLRIGQRVRVKLQ
jgi:multidrug resistance efflux pump